LSRVRIIISAQKGKAGNPARVLSRREKRERAREVGCGGQREKRERGKEKKRSGGWERLKICADLKSKGPEKFGDLRRKEYAWRSVHDVKERFGFRMATKNKNKLKT
jgi:hypothetical protein